MDAKSRPKINIHGHLLLDPARKGDLPTRIRRWEEWNVRYFCCACVSNRPSSRLPGVFENHHFLAAKKEYGEILIGFAGINMHPDYLDTGADIERYRDQGFQGLKAYGNALPYSHDAYFPIWAAAERLQMPILFHTGMFGGVDWDNLELDRFHNAYAINCQPIHLDRIAHHFPRLNLIAAHMGGHWAQDVLSMTKYFKNIFADWTGGSGRKPHIRGILAALLPHPGLDTDMDDPEENLALQSLGQFCFGTDNPEPERWVGPSEIILDRLHATADIKKSFYYNNAARMLGLEVIA